MNQYEFTQAELVAGVERMNSFGSRLTGSAGHKQLIEYLKGEIRAMGIEPHIHTNTFPRWGEKRSALTLHTPSGDRAMHVSSAFPYSGETGPEGVTAELVPVTGGKKGFRKAVGKIAVVQVKDFKHLPDSVLAFSQKRAVPEDLKLPLVYSGPVAAAFLRSPALDYAAELGVKAVVCIWEGMPDEMVEGQYLNFVLKYQGIPTIWVNETDGRLLWKAAKAGIPATVVLEAEREENASVDALCAVIEGNNTEEAILVTTHTDGTNCVEENGPIGLLAMMRHFQKHKPGRTLVFLFVAGHFRIPEFEKMNSRVHSEQSSSGWLHDNRAFWDGKDGHLKAVAGLTVEHLGCTEWLPVNGFFQKTNDVDAEIVYTGNQVMDDIYFAAQDERTQLRTITLRGHNFFHFGEGQSLFNVGIPEIALVTAPYYLCTVSESYEMEKLNAPLMYEQTVAFTKMVGIINAKSAQELGKPDGYSFGIGKRGTKARK